MVGCSLKQIMHLQSEAEWYTDLYWHLIATYIWSNEGRCKDDVAIRHSLVSRNYGKELTIFCFSKFDIAHDLVHSPSKGTVGLRKYMTFKNTFRQFCHLQFCFIQITKLNLQCITKCWLDKTNDRNRTIHAITW